MAGLLDTDDPAQAAEHLSALTLGQVNNKSMTGTSQLSDSEADHIITSRHLESARQHHQRLAVFMRAYAPAAP